MRATREEITSGVSADGGCGRPEDEDRGATGPAADPPDAAHEHRPADAQTLSVAVGAAQRGDEDSFRLLYRAVQPLLLRYLWAMVGDDAEDVASEAWLQIVRDLSSFRGHYDDFRGWAATIARHRAIDHLRRVRRRPSVPVPVQAFVALPGDADPATQAMDMLSTHDALRLVMTLPPDQAEAVLLRVVVGLDHATAGRVLGKRAGAVRTAVYRGLRSLAERLQETYLAPPGGAAPPAGGTSSPAPTNRDPK